MTKERKALYAGSFDIFTNGHAEIVERSLRYFDELVIVVAIHPGKKPLFTQQQRMDILKDIYDGEARVRVDRWDGLIVDYARQNGIGTIVRGLRPTGDFENEFQMASMNKNLYEDIETLFLMTSKECYFISSGLVREIWEHHGDISKFVSPKVAKKLENAREE